MVLLTLVDGKKGPSDILVLVTAYDEPLSFAEWLFIGKCYLDSEASYYPISEGFTGPCMLIEAILEISHGVKFEMIMDKFKLKQKGKTLKIVDKRKGSVGSQKWTTAEAKRVEHRKDFAHIPLSPSPEGSTGSLKQNFSKPPTP